MSTNPLAAGSTPPFNPLATSSAPPVTPTAARGGSSTGSSLGVLSIVFAILIPIVGLVLGILATNEGRAKNDEGLRKQGIIGIVLSGVVMVLAVIIIVVAVSAAAGTTCDAYGYCY